ncbi:MAG: hypothetical protein D6785_09640, partial [Planctomycetota bacterium]
LFGIPLSGFFIKMIFRNTGIKYRMHRRTMEIFLILSIFLLLEGIYFFFFFHNIIGKWLIFFSAAFMTFPIVLFIIVILFDISLSLGNLWTLRFSILGLLLSSFLLIMNKNLFFLILFLGGWVLESWILYFMEKKDEK